MTDEPMRVCVLFDGETTFAWVAEAIERMLAETNAEISLVVVEETEDDSQVDVLRRAIRKPHWARIVGGRLLLDTLIGEPAYRETTAIDDIDGVADAPRIRCTPVKTDGIGNELPVGVVETIRDESDLVFRRGFGIITGDVLTATEFGVLSYHHDDPTEYRGGPAGLWEFLHGRDEAGLMLQLLSEDLDGGRMVVYDEIDISDANTWREVHRRLCVHSIGFLATSVERLQDPQFEPEPIEPLGPIYTAPDIKDYLRYQVKNNMGRLKTVMRTLQ